jgi:glycine/D-amino acid oxidase-like deaminating enzyme
MMSEASDVVIVGGGAAGCAAAYYLARAGVNVTLVEREGVGSQASGYSAGGVNPLHGFLPVLRPLALASFRLHLTLWEVLQSVTGRDCHHRIISMIRMADDETDGSELQDMLEIYEATDGFSAHWLDDDELHALEPRLAAHICRGLYLHGNGIVDSQLFTVLMAEAAERAGATLRTGTVHNLQRSKERITAVILEDGVISCDHVVLAMGAWSKAVEPWLNCAMPIEPMKGEILRMTLPGPALEHDIIASDILLCSRPGPQVWCASTEEWKGFDRNVSESARQTLHHNAIGLMPAIAEARLVQQTACLRPVAPDWLPIIGKAPGWDNAYLATGGAKKGILFSTGIGKAIADLITAGHTLLPIDLCTPERFIDQSPSWRDSA